MKTTMTALAAIALVLGTAGCSGGGTADKEAAAATAGGIAGTWKGDVASAQAENDESKFTLAAGTFTCDSCIPAYSTPADGQWHAVNRPGVDEMMVEVVDDKTVRSAVRLKGKETGRSTWTVGDDGKTLTQAFTDFTGAQETQGTVKLTRTAAGAAGAHAMSGGWTLAEYGQMSDAALLVTYKLEGDTLSQTTNAESWSAKLGGEAVPVEGSTSGVMVKVEKVGEGVYRETYMRGEETVGVNEVTVEGDTLSVVSTDPRNKSVFRFKATRQ